MILKRKNLTIHPQAILLFFCSMLVVFFDLFREDADILFVRSETIKKRRYIRGDDNEHWFFAYFRNKIHIKIYRMFIAHLFYVVYLSLLVLMVWNPFEGEDDHWNHWKHWYSYLAFFFAVNLLVDDIVLFREDGAKRFFKSFWNLYHLIKNLTMVAGLLMGVISDDQNRADLSGWHLLNIAGSFVSIALGLEVFVLLRISAASESLGPVCLCLTSVFKDVLRTMPVYALIFAAHAITALSLFGPFQERVPDNHNYTLVEDHLSSQKNLLSSMWWRLIFTNNAESANIKLRDSDDEEFSFEFFHFVCMALWAGKCPMSFNKHNLKV